MSPRTGKLAVKDTRPISIQSSVCRTVASALAGKTEIRECSSGQSMRTRVEASMTVELLQQSENFDSPRAVLLSLDLKKGYDFADPEIIIGHLKHRGLPLHWCRYLKHIWCHQSR